MDQNEDHTADEALARIHSALSLPANSKLAVFRHEYEHRLRTFTVQNYFGKPHSLSPIICARLGFRNVGNSQLECSGCHEKLRIHFPECLSAMARDKLTCLYEDQLAELHLENCPFRRDAQHYLQQCNKQEEKSSSSDSTIPAVLTQVWRPDEVLELLDPLRPYQVVRERWVQVMEWLEQQPQRIASMDWKSWKLPQIRDQTAFQQFGLVQNGEQLLLEKILQMMVREDADAEQVPTTTRPHELQLGALLIVLLGWTLDTTTEPSSSSLRCGICLSQWNLDLLSHATEGGEGQPPSRKRLCQRMNAPVDSHRYYCPFVRGLPRRHAGPGMPFVEMILLRLLNNDETRRSTPEPVAATDLRLGIRNLLKDVLSPSHSKLTSSVTR